MRILAIRGNNLASLAGEFEINFEAEPINSSGIFAITGPTGAGKSTLLDAVCLALFADIPRLRAAPASGSFDPEEDNLSARDSRSILRHGTGEGYAEVEFAMPHGGRYRARWQVRRSRSKASGRIQKSEHSFERIDTNERMGGTRKETLKAITDVIHLTSDQFTRAVLLAQGDFEAFIRAEANERASLLEKLTGSQIYAQLGQKAYAKAEIFKSELTNIRMQIEAQHGLDDEARAQADQALVEAKHTHSLAHNTIANLEEEGRRQEQRNRLIRAEEDAASKLKDATALSINAAPRRAALEHNRLAFSLSPLLNERSKAHQAFELATTKQTEASVAKHKASEDVVLRGKALQHAAHLLEAREQANTALAPDIAEAKIRDRQVKDTGAKLATLNVQVRNLAQASSKALHLANEAEEKLASSKNNSERIKSWLNENVHLRSLRDREPELLELISNHDTIEVQRQSCAAIVPRYELEESKAHQQLITAQDALSSAETAAEVAFQNKERAEKCLPPEGAIAGLQDKLERISQSELLLIKHAGATQELERLHSELNAIHSERSAIKARCADIASASLQLDETRPRLEGDFATADHVHKQSLLASDKASEALRASLVHGEACPVCGATEHALSSLKSLLGSHLIENKQRRDALEKQLSELRETQHKLFLESDAIAKQDAAFASKETAHSQKLPDVQLEVDTYLSDLNRIVQSLGLQADQDIAPQIAASREALEEQRTAWQEAQNNAQKAQKSADIAREHQTQAERLAQDARDSLRLKTVALNEARTRLVHLADNAQQTANGLDRAFTETVNWKSLPNAAEWLREQVQRWNDYEVQLATIEAALPALVQTLEKATSEKIRTKTDADNALTQQQDTTKLLEEHVEARAKLLGARSVHDVELECSQALTQTTQAKELAQQASALAEQNLAACEATLEAAQAHLRQAEHARSEADQALDGALQRHNMHLAEVERVSRDGAEALDREAKSLTELENAVREAQAVRAKCKFDLEDHQAQEKNNLLPSLSPEELIEQLSIAKHALSEANEALEEAHLKIRQDNAVRDKTAKLRNELENASKRADVWLKLNALIGSKTGDKFRRFAQGLTLDRLLEHANARLLELKPRFALERSSGGDMLIQVIDHDMAGQKRGLHNLSGGERFLVSLALALGLAEMSTVNGVRIESLFIDEGFGALDPSSLGQALALLEHLHASGRRVGIISHVEELKERIPVQIQVTPSGKGTSCIEVVSS